MRTYIFQDQFVAMDVPPAQNSPSHILSALNNDCIKECLRRLTNVRDFLSAAEVCRDFQENAKQCYPKQFKKVIIHDWFYLAYPNGLPSGCMKNFLIIFGHFIDSIEWTSIDSVYVDEHTRIGRDQKDDQQMLNMIADYCGETLTKLGIQNHISNFNTRAPLKILKELTLNNSPPLNFELYLQLTSLKLVRYAIVGNWLIRRFPRLEKVTFMKMIDLSDDMVNDLFELNPQLQAFEITRCDQVTTSIFKQIGTRLPNLTEISLNAPNLQIDDNVMDLSGLRNLKRLTILCKCESAGLLIDRLADNNIPIEYLTLDDVPHDISHNLAKLKRLKQLKVSGASDGMMINIAKRLTFLETIHVNSQAVTINGIQKALEFAQNLVNASIHVKNYSEPIEIDLSMYNSLLALAKGRVKVQIKIHIGTIHVPKDVQNENRKWLNFSNVFCC